jgi:hypothetical protein
MKLLYLPQFAAKVCTAGLLTMLTIVSTACTSKYADEMRSSLERVYNADFRNYTFRGTPVGNFGVGTIYDKKTTEASSGSADVSEEWLLGHPNTWYVDSLSEDEKELLNQSIFETGTLGRAKLTESISTGLSLEAAVPNIRQILDLGATFELKKGVKVTLTASGAINRQMNWSEFREAALNDKIKGYIKDLLGRVNFVICAKDIVLLGYQAEVAVDSRINPGLSAKLNNAIGKILGVESSLQIKMERKQNGNFTVIATHPVVAAVLYKTPPVTVKTTDPAAHTFVTMQKYWGDNMDDWTDEKIENTVLNPLEALLSKKEEDRTKR